MNYIRIALRIQARYKGFALVNVFGLSLGILCSLLLSLYVTTHLSTDTHHTDAGCIYRMVLDIQTPAGGIEYEEGSPLPLGKALQHEYSAITQSAFCMKFYTAPTIAIQQPAGVGRYKEDRAAYADQDFIDMFAFEFINGNKQMALSGARSIVLSRQQAIKYFGTTDVAGRTVNINNNTDLVVTGVFNDLHQNTDLKFDLLVSLPTLRILNPNYQDQNFTWTGSNNWTFVKLAKASTAAEVNDQLPAFTQKYLDTDFRHWHFRLQPLADIHFDTRYDGIISKRILWVLSSVAAALICIVCINYVNLTIAQSQQRAKEIGVRKYLGGSRAQLFLQFMTETTLVVLTSVVLAGIGCYFALPVMNTWLQTGLSFLRFATPVYMAYLAFFVVAVIAIAGYYPAVVLSGFHPIKALAGKTGKTGKAGKTLRTSLIGFQYVIAMVFLISTFIITQQVDFLVNNDPGFTKNAVVNINLPRSTASRLQAFREEVAALSGVASVSLHNQAPLSATMDGGFIRYNNRSTFEDFIVRDRWADDRFADTYALTLVAGRNLLLHDSVTEVLVNEALVSALDITDPHDILGHAIAFDNSSLTGTIVGVVRDFHHRSLQSSIEPLAIYPFPRVFNQAGIRLASAGNERTLADVETIWKRTFPDEVMQISFLDQSIRNLYSMDQVTGKLMTVFAVVAAILCSIGILGLSTFTLLQRTREIGIRKVLGASTLGIIAMLCKHYLALITIALAIAIPLTWLLTRQWLSTFAYHIPLHWVQFAIPGLGMLVITLLLIGSQSLKTALTNPSKSLKHE
jgi:putative ABC transport system permease protein